MWSTCDSGGGTDRTCNLIAKPKVGPEDYLYFKIHGYCINCQVVVDSHKRFLDLFQPGSTNDTRALCWMSLYHLAQNEGLFHVSILMDDSPSFF